jgi:murein hydrolase activator
MRVPRLDRVLCYGAGVILAGAVLSSPARSETPADKLHAIEQQEVQSRVQRDTLTQAAEALKTEIDGLRRQSVTLAEVLQRHEAALTLLETQLSDLGDKKKKLTADLRREESHRAALLMALVQLARHAPEAATLSSADPADIERGALVMGEAVPRLDRAAHRLGKDLAALTALRQAITRAKLHHEAEQQSLNHQQLSLANLITRKAVLEQRAQEGAAVNDKRLTELAAEATNLRDLIQRLDRHAGRRLPKDAVTDVAAMVPPPRKPTPPGIKPPEPKPPEAKPPAEMAAAPAAMPPDLSKPSRLRPFDDAFGHYLLPVSGKLVGRFGKAHSGLENRGITYETRTGAQVVAPFDGRVLFAGPFLGYGEVLIIEHSDGYHSVLAGLDRLDVTVGQWLVAGEPVGTMPKGKGRPRLYLELRHDGQPINPLPWLATSNEKVSG